MCHRHYLFVFNLSEVRGIRVVNFSTKNVQEHVGVRGQISIFLRGTTSVSKGDLETLHKYVY